jgi:hypothetical protein
MNKVNIVDIHYFGNLSYYKIFYSAEYNYFEQYDQHKKLSYSNRCIIAGANGLLTLSVPLEKGRNQRTILKDIKISNVGKWQKDHWKGLVSCYNASPWFGYYSDELAAVFSRSFEFLLDWNLLCHTWVMEKLQANVKYKLTEEYKLYPDNPLIKDCRNLVLPNRENAEAESIHYTQVFQDRFGFRPNLSVLDILFCAGPKKAAALLMG